MIIIECEQGGDVWRQSRAGVITASMFGLCRKRLRTGKNKGAFTDAAKKYAFKLAVERISGDLLEEDKLETWEMRRGRELEPTARLMHEQENEIIVERAGLVLTDDKCFGASVDGFFDPDSICEYKCFVAPDRLRKIIINRELEDGIMDQIQGGLWITGRKHAEFVLYCPALENINKSLTVLCVDRNEEWIEDLEFDLLAFNGLVDQYVATLKT